MQLSLYIMVIFVVAYFVLFGRRMFRLDGYPSILIIAELCCFVGVVIFAIVGFLGIL